jgi:hypothetical protein
MVEPVCLHGSLLANLPTARGTVLYNTRATALKGHFDTEFPTNLLFVLLLPCLPTQRAVLRGILAPHTRDT